jgi:ABC-2 type transport system permease protein
MSVSRSAASRSPLRPYRAAFRSRFATLLAYRSAALAGVTTQCWWGALKVMILSAFYSTASAGAAPPISLSDAITYVWVSQALFAMLPWTADPVVAADVKSGAVGYDRLRPVDTYAFWYARSAGWLAARTLPRALLLAVVTALGLPLLGLSPWACQLPSSASAALGFSLALALALALAAAVVMLLNSAVVTLLDERGINALILPFILVFSGNLLPLALFPESLRRGLLLQPLAGLLDIPLRIYFAELSGPQILMGLGLQLFWTLALMLAGRLLLGRALVRLQIQGG